MAASPPSFFAPGLIVLFGGFDGTRLRNETWILDLSTQTWGQLAVSGNQPSPREGHVLTFDPTVSAFVLHGGRTTSVPGATGHGNLALNDMWQFNPTNMSWHQLTLFPGREGPVLHDHAMVFDGRRGQLMIYGGHQASVNGAPMGDEMHFTRNFLNGQHAWIQNGAVTSSPQGRVRHAMTFDPILQRVIMFGGQKLQGTTLVPTNEFFEFDSNVIGNGAWVPITASPTLFATYGAEMTFDPIRGRTVFFGNAAGATSAPVMEYDGQFWSRAAVPTLQTTGRGFTFDPVTHRCAFYSGSVAHQTRTYAPTVLSAVTRFGADNVSNGLTCRFQTGALPLLDKETMLEWQVGTTRNLRVSNLPPQFETAFVLASFAQAPTPIAVGGAPGCFQLIDNPTQTLPLVLTGAQSGVNVSITIPVSPAYVGLHAYYQSLVTDANAPRGYALSNAVDVLVGAM